MILLRCSSSMNRIAVTVAALTVVMGCEGGPAGVGPLPEVDGTWTVHRTVVSWEGCAPLPDLRPVPMTFRTTGGSLELEFMTSPTTTLLFSGALQEDGDFEIQRNTLDPGFFNDRSLLIGRFVEDTFTATETNELDILDPGLIELMGTDRCESVMHWEGERTQP